MSHASRIDQLKESLPSLLGAIEKVEREAKGLWMWHVFNMVQYRISRGQYLVGATRKRAKA